MKIKRLIAAVVGVLLIGAGVASASIPGPDGTVFACRSISTGYLRVIDRDAGQSCNLSWETKVDLASPPNNTPFALQTYAKYKEVIVPAGTNHRSLITVEQTCDANDTTVNGGWTGIPLYANNDDLSFGLVIVSDGPGGVPAWQGWAVSAFNTSTEHDIRLIMYVTCTHGFNAGIR